jgi:nucleoside-diphosphate-sugar epimerase
VRILIVGAAGVLGRATLPHLAGHDVTGTTRSPEKRAALAALGARAEICDVYEVGALERVASACSPDVVVNFLTDLGDGPGPANSRIRREGGPVVTAAALASGARRLVVESIAFAVGEDSAAAVAVLEENCLGSGLDALVLRFGRFWGPDTWTHTAPEPPAVHIAEAGRRAASLILGGPPGIHVVTDRPDHHGREV